MRIESMWRSILRVSNQGKGCGDLSDDPALRSVTQTSVLGSVSDQPMRSSYASGSPAWIMLAKPPQSAPCRRPCFFEA